MFVRHNYSEEAHMFRDLLVRFWSDESGAIVATEYLLLGSVVVVGGVSGMTAVRDSVNDEYKEFGNSVREVRQTYSKPAMKGGSGSVGGTTVINPTANGAVAQADPLAPVSVPAVPTAAAARVTFASP
jgi:Flp pilus assembly pilin Flp